MKKTVLLSIVAAFLFISATNAQSKKNEIDLGVGLWSTNQIIGSLTDVIASGLTGVDMDNSTYIGAFHLGYKYSLSDRFALGPVFAFDLGTSDAMSPAITCFPPAEGNLKDKIGKFTNQYYSLALEADYKYINRDKFRLYSLIGIGGTVLNQEYKPIFTPTEKSSESQIFFNFQVTPVGVKFGNSFGAFAELGFGYKGILCVGIFSRF